VQSAWVEELWRWTGPADIVDKLRFFVWPASADLDEFPIFPKSRVREIKALHYTKYQNNENFNWSYNIYNGRGHNAIVMRYGEYDIPKLIDNCSKVEYCIYNSCCEKSSNAMMEILACDIPIYVVDAKRWIGDDRFITATSAPHFDDRCGMIGDPHGAGFDEFYHNVLTGKYHPREFVADGFTVEHNARRLLQIVEECHG
jgi:hypothetical protein